MAFWNKISAAPVEAEPDISDYVEHTETFTIGRPIKRLDKDLSGVWSVELSDGQYVSLDRLAKAWLHHNPSQGPRVAGQESY